MLARDMMTETAVVVPKDMLVTELVMVLRDKRIGGVPVIDDDKKVCGIVTVTDCFNVMRIVRKLGRKKTLWFSSFVFSKRSITVKEIYTRKVISVLPDTPVEKVVELMLDKNIHTIPVMNEDQSVLYGVIGRHDITYAALGPIPPKVREKAGASPQYLRPVDEDGTQEA